jgi:hypothetical protein
MTRRFSFANGFESKGGRTRDQMVQAARSGKQNILEGSQASGTSEETEIKVVNVARASLGELLEDYRDFSALCAGCSFGDKSSRQPRFVRRLGSDPNSTCKT